METGRVSLSVQSRVVLHGADERLLLVGGSAVLGCATGNDQSGNGSRVFGRATDRPRTGEG